MLRQTDGAMWSLSELTQAVVIVTHVHALSIFLAGCKLYSADAILALLGSSNCSEPPTDELSLRIFPASNLSSSLVSLVNIFTNLRSADCVLHFQSCGLCYVMLCCGLYYECFLQCFDSVDWVTGSAFSHCLVLT